MSVRSISRLTFLAVFLVAALSHQALSQTYPRMLVWDEAVRDGNDNPLRWPVGVAAASADEVAVAEAREPSLLIFRRESDTWKLAQRVQLDGTPYSVAHDGKRYAVSLRQGAGLVGVEGEPFQLRRIALPVGAVPGAVAGLPGGGFLVYDSTSKTVLRLDTAGKDVGRTAIDDEVSALAPSPTGGFYAVIARHAELRRYGANGEELERETIPGIAPVPAWPVGIALDPGGDLLVVDRHNGRLLILNAVGRVEGVGSRKGWDVGLLRFPAGVAVLPDGRVAVADQGNARVQLFTRSAKDGSP
jgi:hypothetical protein